MALIRASQYFLPTWKEDPAEAELPSHKLMLRAGMIRKLAAGIYTYLPLARRALHKIEKIIREEMDAIGGMEITMPMIHPAELWAETGRLQISGPSWAGSAIGQEGKWSSAPPTRKLLPIGEAGNPVLAAASFGVYQIQTKFPDEPRPRGGLVRAREFTMKDAYSFHESKDDLDHFYREIYQAYLNIFRRCGLSVVPVEADPGLMGGSESHEFMLPSPYGEDSFIQCENGDYAANLEGATSLKDEDPPEPLLPLEEVATPGCYTIEAVANFLGIPPRKTAKAVFYRTGEELVFVVIRGDLEVNEAKLARALRRPDLRPATEEEIAEIGAVPGYASPIGIRRNGVKVVVDDSIPKRKTLSLAQTVRDSTFGTSISRGTFRRISWRM
jgi:Prolyl-tRNA synthetase